MVTVAMVLGTGIGIATSASAEPRVQNGCIDAVWLGVCADEDRSPQHPTADFINEYDYLCEGVVEDWVPHPDSDTKAIQCSHGTAWEWDCPTGAHFDAQEKHCVAENRTRSPR
ncbi:carbohydrate-binding module family 14 protein [Nocardia abscessus]|uniref:carbohydrate-binding module family 14 protein n=1 Tax=Nocardia abscessus TaxID=120957 RepID=UPI002458E0AE|nr:carbohydrate-binding module family 14 protein [Nocardia abscessus]